MRATTQLKPTDDWHKVCHIDQLIPGMGIVARVNGRQLAIFKTEQGIFALDNVDPFCRAAVLSRGIVGDLNGRLVVASPMYKQHFCLRTGLCVEDDTVSVQSWRIRQDPDGMLYARPHLALEVGPYAVA
ncbi:MAG TPA: nitrite reductase small subunit NirD [Burkholderiaceae bacterium]|uniref:nitrite reductase small subunit NirD n=1 Tax=Pusillimonas sp. (ex Stolz et al. 2005) TaxID=1979962 RepID=UPI00262141AC|nr:nitrite reductase small subunit NirD [Pusillimonas sp. (ex Stolz et al. 2005)]HLU00192.1 nitrite reductase small subunit NirD [Burkholderiaceae bacterium]